MSYTLKFEADGVPGTLPVQFDEDTLQIEHTAMKATTYTADLGDVPVIGEDGGYTLRREGGLGRWGYCGCPSKELEFVADHAPFEGRGTFTEGAVVWVVNHRGAMLLARELRHALRLVAVELAASHAEYQQHGPLD